MHSADIVALLKRAGFTQAQVAKKCEVAPSVVNAVLKGKARSKRVEEFVSELTGLRLQNLWPQHYGGMPPEPGAEAILMVDPQRLAWICHAIEAAVEEQLQVKGHANPRVLGLIYNKVLSRGRGADDVELAKAEVCAYLESLRIADIPEHDLAKRLLRLDPARHPPATGTAVAGDGNQVAGRDIRAGSKVTKPK